MLEPSGTSLEKRWNRIKSECIERIEERLEILNIYNTSDHKILVFSPSEYITYYSLAYDMCTQRGSRSSEFLYNKLGETLSQYIQSKVCINLQGNNISDDELKHVLLNGWIRYYAYLNVLRKIFAYLDRFYVQMALQPTIHEYGSDIFQRLVFEPYKSYLKDKALDILDMKRFGRDHSHESDVMLRGIIEMYNQFGSASNSQYKEQLEPSILNRANNYYSSVAPIWIKELSLKDYLHVVEHCLEEESINCKKYLNGSSQDLLLKTVSSALLYNQTRTLQKKFVEIVPFLEENNIEELKHIYQVAKQTEGCPQWIADHLKTAIERNVANVELKNGIEGIIKLFSRYKAIMSHCFSDRRQPDNYLDAESSGEIPNAIIQNAFFEAFETYARAENAFPKLLADYWNCLIIQRDEEAINEKLEHCADISNLSYDKDIFFEYYLMQLARRLLREESIFSVEQLAVSKLKIKCECQQTLKIENMLLDIKKSEKITRSFDREGVKITTISRANWPTMNDYGKLSLDKVFSTILDDFESFYKLKTRHRKIEWMVSLSCVELGFSLSGAEKTIKCDMAQATVLMMFNKLEDGALDVKSIADSLSIDDTAVIAILQPLVQLSNPILRIKNISGRQMVEFNYDFESGTRVTHPICYSSQILKTSTSGENSMDSSATIDSTLMRIMKEFKTLEENDLITKLRSNLGNMQLEHEIIRERIASLMQRDYIHKNENTLTYVP